MVDTFAGSIGGTNAYLRDQRAGRLPQAYGRLCAELRSQMTYDQYVALVVAYLAPEHAEIYSSREAWESMQLHVIERLEAVR